MLRALHPDDAFGAGQVVEHDGDPARRRYVVAKPGPRNIDAAGLRHETRNVHLVVVVETRRPLGIPIAVVAAILGPANVAKPRDRYLRGRHTRHESRRPHGLQRPLAPPPSRSNRGHSTPDATLRIPPLASPATPCRRNSRYPAWRSAQDRTHAHGHCSKRTS